MSDTVIKVENISKEYRLGTISHGTLYRDLQSWSAKLLGKEDPNSRIELSVCSDQNNTFKALNDISFEVKQGDILGLIGRNGAGKSTLLKIISKITAPSNGLIKIKGRVASLLEVGTGFHPELTGRENVFLNGAILGMNKSEIRSKFDEIVAFAEIEKFIDTPVKRYSSGMYVRLAFAVAAHLEPEILIVDEVLAVGDAEFQKKCLGKMQDVSAKEGRTVLFVSHNMEAITNLCSLAILLKSGTMISKGKTHEVVQGYLSQFAEQKIMQEWPDLAMAPGNEKAKLIKASVRSLGSSPDVFQTDTGFEFEFVFFNQSTDKINLDVTYHLTDERGILVYVGSTGFSLDQFTFGRGNVHAKCRVPSNLLNVGKYTVNRLLLVKDRGTVVYEHRDALIFEIVLGGKLQLGWVGEKEGVIKPILEWEFI